MRVVCRCLIYRLGHGRGRVTRTHSLPIDDPHNSLGLGDARGHAEASVHVHDSVGLQIARIKNLKKKKRKKKADRSDMRDDDTRQQKHVHQRTTEEGV